MIKHLLLSNFDVKRKIKNNEICYAGNIRLKIYGQLNCRSGKRMKRENRVFFNTEEEALQSGFRPCGHCQNKKYKKWIYSISK
ncbi:Ada metal-binding domain-containing protein [Pedobacter rhizosphaerae]|uniref:Metal binding domain of Ada n=1 Tax=Pedobacter rhizosphaerae TaxID=390241 RepID=A0A1H9QF06_9SPHI|nr:Ada metal-binding domain-containing protein [Pedobacter rhizosphaerae]SER58745.1 Metal binding domain of Ada [Pedobacter rhizosphaerae]